VFQSHHQWFLPPTIGIRAPFVRKQKSFGIYLNFQSCQKHILIIPRCRVHPYELTGAKINFIGSRGSPHAPPEHSDTVAHAQPTRPEEEDDWSSRAPYSSRAEPPKLPLAEPREYSRFNPSEPPNVQNRFLDRFTPFLTHFQQSQTGSLLF